MSKGIIAVAMAAALVGCATAPEGHDAATWRKDRRECIAQAKAEAVAKGGPATPMVAGLWTYALPSKFPNSPGWLDAHTDRCMVARGYPPEN